MFKNYLITAVRNLLRFKGFTLINILSLIIGITGCMLIALFVWDEKQFDTGISQGENIYRVYEESNNNNNLTYIASVPPAYASFLKQQYPEVTATARILMTGDRFFVENGNKKAYEEKGWIAEASFFDIFPIPFLKGSSANALTEPYTVVLSERMAATYFGAEDPLGKTILIDKDTFQVKGVMAALPDHFHLDFSYVMSLPTANIASERMEKWTWHQFYTYVKLQAGTSIESLQDKFQMHVKKEIFPSLPQTGATYLPFFQLLKDIHLESADFTYDIAIRGNGSYVKGLIIIALFVLAIACFNFINIATAKSFRRAKEIGVRKVAGADRRQLIIQFIGETVLLALISVIIATVATIFILPSLNDFTGKSIYFNPILNPLLGLLILLGGIIIGIFAGIYPAVVLSGFQPTKVLKNLGPGLGSAGWLRHSLVIAQFTISTFLIVSSLIVYRQIRFLNDKDLGFKKEQVIFFPVTNEVEQNLAAFKSELKASPNVLSVTSGYGLPGDQYAGDGIHVPGEEGDKEYPAKVFIGDHDYINTLGLNVIAGRDFSRDMQTDVNEAFIINETAVKELGFGTPEKALGRRLNWKEWAPADSTKPVKNGRVIGVVQDFHYQSLHEKITTSVLQLNPQIIAKIAVKVNTKEIGNSIGFINTVWNKFSPGLPLDYKFIDDSYGKMYKTEESLGRLIGLFTLMAIFISCMGLFGLAAFSARQRKKEIGIRKVLGASILNITSILSKEFIRLVLIASLIGFPVAWWAMHSWLEGFSYRIVIHWWMFIVAGAAALLIAIVTVSFQAIKTAIHNPITSLRSE